MRAERNHIGCRHGMRGWVIPAVLVALAGCTTGGDSITQPKNTIDEIPWRVMLNHHAVTTVIGEPVQLEATPVNVDGTPVPGLPPVQWIVGDSSVLSVDSTGKLVGLTEGDRVTVYARVHSLEGNWTIEDTAKVSVVSAPYDFTSFGMLPDGPLLVPANVWRNYDAVLRDAGGSVLEAAPGDTIYPSTYYVSSEPKSTFSSSSWWGGGQPKNLGQVTIHASAFMFGTQYEDSVTFTLTYPDSAGLYIFRVSSQLDPSPSMMGQTDITILKGGKIGFSNLNTTENVDIVFDDTTNAIGGNIPEVPQGYAWQHPPAVVTFPNTGTFTYHSSKGFGGTVTVVDWP
ncbi:MAG TPA: hypothetical protein VF041_12010 [Gemmatimonadaceae bacterium]